MIEAVVTLGVMAPLLLGLYSLLDSSNRLTKQESNVAQAQQASRGGIYEIARMVRQARVGQLYYGSAVLPIYDNAPAGKTIPDISGTGHTVRPGTDVVEVRGVILGEKFAITSADLTCSGSCDGTSQITVVIRSTTFNGVSNYPATRKPLLAAKVRPFYLVVADSSPQRITIAGKTYLTPLYYVGLVNADATGGWYTYSSDGTTATFSFAMNPSDAGAKMLNATGAGSPGLQNPFFCGAVDDILFFVDEGTSAGAGDTHPTLAMATYDPSSAKYDVQALVDEAEDFQVAYGVDGADGSAADGGADPVKVDVSATNKDEWIGNVAGETEASLGTPATSIPRSGSVAAFLDSSLSTSETNPEYARPLLRSIWLSLVVKSRDPDLQYDGPGARGVATLDSTAKSMSDPAITGRPYRRRVQALAISLRNFQ